MKMHLFIAIRIILNKNKAVHGGKKQTYLHNFEKRISDSQPNLRI